MKSQQNISFEIPILNATRMLMIHFVTITKTVHVGQSSGRQSNGWPLFMLFPKVDFAAPQDSNKQLERIFILRDQDSVQSTSYLFAITVSWRQPHFYLSIVPWLPPDRLVEDRVAALSI